MQEYKTLRTWWIYSLACLLLRKDRCFNAQGLRMCCLLSLIQIKQSIFYLDSDIVSFYLTSISVRQCDVIYFWHSYSRRSTNVLTTFKHASVQINAAVNWDEIFFFFFFPVRLRKGSMKSLLKKKKNMFKKLEVNFTFNLHINLCLTFYGYTF